MPDLWCLCCAWWPQHRCHTRRVPCMARLPTWAKRSAWHSRLPGRHHTLQFGGGRIGHVRDRSSCIVILSLVRVQLPSFNSAPNIQHSMPLFYSVRCWKSPAEIHGLSPKPSHIHVYVYVYINVRQMRMKRHDQRCVQAVWT